MRILEFDMERKDLVKIGDEVEVFEKRLPFTYYYTIIPAIAMSRNIEPTKRLKTSHGKVTDIQPFGTRSIVYVEFDEEE